MAIITTAEKLPEEINNEVTNWLGKWEFLFCWEREGTHFLTACVGRDIYFLRFWQDANENYHISEDQHKILSV